MNFFALIVCALSILLTASFIWNINMAHVVRDAREKASNYRNAYYDVVYSNCVLTSKLERIRDLGLIDYEGNDEYRELLTTKID